MNAEERIAREMFAAYNAQGPNPGKTWDGKDVPPWERCGEQVQGKWIAAARAALRAVTIPQPQKLAVGRVLLYRLSQSDVDAIMRRRTNGASIADRIATSSWPLGAQAHIGNPVAVGDELPLHVARVWPNEFGEGAHGVNGQVMLDGNDQLWVTSVGEGVGPGTWSWPQRT